MATTRMAPCVTLVLAATVLATLTVSAHARLGESESPTSQQPRFPLYASAYTMCDQTWGCCELNMGGDSCAVNNGWVFNLGMADSSQLCTGGQPYATFNHPSNGYRTGFCMAQNATTGQLYNFRQLGNGGVINSGFKVKLDGNGYSGTVCNWASCCTMDEFSGCCELTDAGNVCVSYNEWGDCFGSPAVSWAMPGYEFASVTCLLPSGSPGNWYFYVYSTGTAGWADSFTATPL